jgi:hypothetical protein
MNDFLILFVLVGLTIICNYLSFKAAKETQLLIDLHAKKFKTDTYNDIVKKMVNKPVIGPLWGIKKSFSILPIIFKKTKDPEIDIHARRIKEYYFFMISLIVLVFSAIIIYGFSVYGLP